MHSTLIKLHAVCPAERWRYLYRFSGFEVTDIEITVAIIYLWVVNVSYRVIKLNG